MRVLIIEDEEKLASALKKGFEHHGFVADYVLDGEAGEKRIEFNSEDYDVVILDLMLPKKDGFEVCKSIRKQGIMIPILVLTARGTTEDKISALDFGADDYLVKPFSLDELIARVRALLRRPREILPEELQVGELRLNPTTRKVYRNSKEIPLTLKEFSVLEYLIRHPNQVVNREQILDHSWDYSFDSFSNVVDVNIKNIRHKLGYYGKNQNKILETVRGVGYRLKI